MTASAPMTTADAATALDTTPRELRKFLRSEGAGVGQGKRYALPGTKKELTSLTKRFNAWKASQAELKAQKEQAQEVDEVEVIDAEGEDPTDDELDAIDAEV